MANSSRSIFYDHLGKREKLLGSNLIYFKEDSPLKPAITRGFEYSDCTVDDARLVVLNALQAKRKGQKLLHVHVVLRLIDNRNCGIWSYKAELSFIRYVRKLL